MKGKGENPIFDVFQKVEINLTKAKEKKKKKGKKKGKRENRVHPALSRSKKKGLLYKKTVEREGSYLIPLPNSQVCDPCARDTRKDEGERRKAPEKWG